MTVVGVAFRLVHLVDCQLFLHFFHARSLCSGRYVTGVQIVCPFLDGAFSHAVEIIDFQNVVFGVEVAHHIGAELLLLERAKLQQFSVMDASELRLAVVDDVCALAQRKVDDVHAVHFAHVFVSLAFLDVFRHEFRRSEEHSLEVCELSVVLHFNEEQVAFVVFSQHVHPVVLVVLVVLVALALQHSLYLYLHAEQRCEQSFKNPEVCLLPEQPFHGPVEAYVLVLFHWRCAIY